ncbi:tRNA (cytosine(72)-C(5))-methyltransferase NSUN6-like [Macrosteles quadrilineatus]|uniref:tRNA (cytosine(72)-C(5))-methyltransferase NSUN6-like n=1 Tax=Macrosteles quadrilineatus TaxID=74068 RepID=UPI0023E1C9B2|nr:tRNA (cytosine(72)-C(5))-methyltransferase NSUN6-like [Macrosteles quadrilineatus]
MDLNKPIIFKHSDILKAISEIGLCAATDGIWENQEFLEDWFVSPPRFTTIRINTLLSSAEEVENLVIESLNNEALRRGELAPRVSRFPDVPELLVLDPWVRLALPQPPQREVVVDAACGAAVLRGANVFAPGLLAVPSGTQVGDDVSVFADTAGLCLRGLSVPFSGPGKFHVGAGVMRMSRKQLLQNDNHPKGIAVEMTLPASHVSSVTLPPHLGLLQNLPSVLCSRVVDPRPGDKVIDLCAAPGHKTTHLAALMNNQGILIALDKIGRKIETMKKLCTAMGAEVVRSFMFDATKAVSHEASDDWSPPFLPDTFDRVLLDAPCSALGQRPLFGNSITAKQLTSHPRLQKKLFDTAVQLVKPGGTIVYSTCSITVEENEDVVSWALDRYPQLALVPALPLVGRPGSSKSSLTEMQRCQIQRFGPPIGSTPQLDTIGFFIAKFTKLS